MPHFASPTTLLKKLAFTLEGTTLLHSVQQQVFVWDVKAVHLRGVVDGELFGVADDGKTFITRQIDPAWIERDIAARSGAGRQSFLADTILEPRFTLWDVALLKRLNFVSTSPRLYPPHQRFHMMADRYRHLIQLNDVFGIAPPRILDLQSATHEEGILENWLIASDDQHLAIIYYVSGGGFDWNGGVCVRLEDGQKAYSFEGGRDDFPPYLYFSRKHHWLISPYGSTLTIYALADGTRLHKIHSPVSSAAAHPSEMLLAEISDTRSKISLRDVEHPNTPVWEVKQVSEALDVEFHPDSEKLAVSLKNGSVEIRSVKTGQLLTKLTAS